MDGFVPARCGRINADAAPVRYFAQFSWSALRNHPCRDAGGRLDRHGIGQSASAKLK
ncbi:hypothetical protein KCP71_03065 [Salmonella enterica subsp. enterica]|nr:hypothetical protein KCP71_03065 [Salmonella enterica subsp. enterica]